MRQKFEMQKQRERLNALYSTFCITSSMQDCGENFKISQITSSKAQNINIKDDFSEERKKRCKWDFFSCKVKNEFQLWNLNELEINCKSRLFPISVLVFLEFSSTFFLRFCSWQNGKPWKFKFSPRERKKKARKFVCLLSSQKTKSVAVDKNKHDF